MRASNFVASNFTPKYRMGFSFETVYILKTIVRSTSGASTSKALRPKRSALETRNQKTKKSCRFVIFVTEGRSRSVDKAHRCAGATAGREEAKPFERSVKSESCGRVKC